jgi:DNA-binding GntR family transcriptional regulator
MQPDAPMLFADADGVTPAQQAYTRLKDLIVTLALRPGAMIREGVLQETLGLGRTPLREAIHRLSHQNMLHIYPRRAVVVAKLGVLEVRQIFEVRLALETASASLAAQRIAAREMEALLALGAELRRSRDEADVSQFLLADQACHRAIAQYAHNTLLAEHIDHLLSLNLWLWHMYFEACGMRGTHLFAHESIIEAIAARDAAAAATAMREHILGSREQLLTGW